MNGRDVSNLAHEEAVNEFLNAPEPILVEVRRRLNDEPIIKTPTAENKSDEPAERIDDKVTVDTVTTEEVKNVELENGSKKDLVSIGIQTEQFPFENELIFNESPISDHPCNGFNECITPAIDIEVRKTNLLSIISNFVAFTRSYYSAKRCLFSLYFCLDNGTLYIFRSLHWMLRK